MTAEYWQRLLAAELNPAKSRALMEGSGSLADSPILSDREREKVRDADMQAMERALSRGVRILTSDEYPETLSALDCPPPALFVDGCIESLYRPCVAIVGTRNASHYGRACAFKFAQAFARAGVTVISGGALGIDANAHKGALEARGSTAAVLAGGVDHVYPAVHGPLFRQICDQGCLISQFAAGSRPNEYKFLVRNGLVAALSLAILVVEAPYRSGALRTAHEANELGREVFVVPSDVDRLSFNGSFHLIREGATLVYTPDQVLESIGVDPVKARQAEPPASTVAQKVLSALSTTPIPTEKIAEVTGIDAAELLSELTMLELDGQVVREAGGYAVRL